MNTSLTKDRLVLVVDQEDDLFDEVLTAHLEGQLLFEETNNYTINQIEVTIDFSKNGFVMYAKSITNSKNEYGGKYSNTDETFWQLRDQQGLAQYILDSFLKQ